MSAAGPDLVGLRDAVERAANQIIFAREDGDDDAVAWCQAAFDRADIAYREACRSIGADYLCGSVREHGARS